jgi:broad specificity phosphatase PhoE
MNENRWRWIAITTSSALLAVLLAARLIPLNATTVVLIVRHAERAAAPPGDPPLTADGQQRAETLAHVAANAGVTAIFATELQRTQQTVQPLATQLGVSVTQIPAADVDALVDQIRAQQGTTVLVAGHTNTIPEIIQKLGGGTIPAIAETEFDNLFVLTIPRLGFTRRLVRLQYGNPT